MNFIPHTPAEKEEMLKKIGLKNLDDLFASIPQQLKEKKLDIEGYGQNWRISNS